MFSFVLKKIAMKKYLQIIPFLAASFLAQAQQNYFVYVQTDNKQPFYAKINNKILSSSASGYLVIPKLNAGSYNLNIGFPKKEWPEQTFSFDVANADVGYLLKNFGDKGWGLYNLQTLGVIIAEKKNRSPIKNNKEDDEAFSHALSTATNTQSLKIEKENPVKNNEASQVFLPQKQTQSVLAISNIADGSGRSAIYIDKGNIPNDTITIFIPFPKPIIISAQAPGVVSENISFTKEIDKEKDKKFLDIDMPVVDTAQTIKPAILVNKENNADNLVVNTIKPVTQPSNILTFNSDCKYEASDNDFLKIRKKMAAAFNDDEMISASVKFFNSKCYSTEQVKNLSLLFLNDAGKYKFFDAAYAHIYDTQNFASLQLQIKDAYYINRFKAIIRN